jgi:hypothetical protein
VILLDVQSALLKIRKFHHPPNAYWQWDPHLSISKYGKFFVLAQNMHRHVVVPYSFDREHRNLSGALSGLVREYRVTKFASEG